ncbi:polycystic kidney disease 1 like 1 [Hippocampus zosterae]|uniref:polycystic kidney disease 1 like 1 n=1 Tax=Hippocampus zosterae TaxID=109293 RepID=UPI00223DCE67|nr:polycystic kidney disease 1 like 1 [Hippocampus zosterae]
MVEVGGPNDITVELLCGTSVCQSSQQVNVSDDGSFAVSCQWIWEGSAEHEIKLTVFNPISEHFCPPGFCAAAPSEIFLLHGTPLPHASSQSGTAQAVYVGDPVTLRACAAGGPAARLCWSFRHREGDAELGVERTCEAPNGSLAFVPSPANVTAANMIDRSVSVYTTRQAYPTDTDVTFSAVTDVPGPLDIFWNFGDSTTGRSGSRNVTKRYDAPGSYEVTALLSDGRTSLTSGALSVLIQRPVKLNKLVHRASVLRNQTITVSCRVDSGTDVTFLWSFGDGTTRSGQSVERHAFLSTGEFLMEVTASNRVSRGSLSSVIFVSERPCRPPPVKNMGPLKLQVPRHDVIRLGVSYEGDVECDASRGLRYTWTLSDSAGRVLPVADAHGQRLVLPGHLLRYDTYAAVARVEVVGSVVYSNYSVRLQVIPGPPVASIQGGTNIFVKRANTTVVTLDGRRSYDPDFPTHPFSVTWTCQPVSSIKSSCFKRHVASGSAVLTFPTGSLQPRFDQFQFTLTVRSGARSASTEAFVTLTPSVLGRLAVSCLQCDGDQVNWDGPITVRALCEDCEVPPNRIQYTWTLHSVNASSKAAVEVPFCFTLDLGAPSTIKETASMPTSHLQPHAPNSSQPAHPLDAFVPTEAIAGGSCKSTSDRVRLLGRLGSRRWTRWSIELCDRRTPPFVKSRRRERKPLLSGAGSRVPWQIAEEGEPGISAGRLRGADVLRPNPRDDTRLHPAPRDSEGSNLVESRPRQAIRKQTLIDLPREPIDARSFASYTYTGLSSALLSLRPFSLKPGNVYMLEVIAKCPSRILGRTQLFLRTKPIPKGMTCQVQPSKGLELYTHFGIFCTSGREDLLYEYSFSVGREPPRMLYQGRNFQYYFSLPSGHPGNDYKVTVYTKIRSGLYGSSTQVCPVTVQVRPSFFRTVSFPDPDVVLSQSGLKNLSALIVLGNSAEISNYVSLLSRILNRLSSDSQADQRAQSHLRNVLISALCKLESPDQDSTVDNVGILRDLFQVPRQVTLASVRQAVTHVKAISAELSRPGAPKRYRPDRRTLDTLVAVLSRGLEAAIGAHDVADATRRVEPHPPVGFDSGKGLTDDDLQTSPSQRPERLVETILLTASDLILKHTLSEKSQEHAVRSGFVSLFVARRDSAASVIGGDSATFYTPAPLTPSLRGECVLSLLAELDRSPWSRATYPERMNGPVVDLTLYECGTGKKISVGSLVQPITAEMRPRQDKKEAAHEYVLLPNRVAYHSFNVTRRHSRQAIQLSVAFTPPPTRSFTITLLFRMFAKPSPGTHHLRKIHRWETRTARITLPPSYLKTPGVGYLALFNGDFDKPIGRQRPSSPINYTLEVDASQCLSLDRLKGAWTPLGCSTRQADGTRAVNCRYWRRRGESCHRLRAMTVVRKQIGTVYEAADLDAFLSEAADVTVPLVLLLCACLYVPALMGCRRADMASEPSCRVHYLGDNCPREAHLYAVTVHTGLRSAYRLSAKVYVALYGGDRTSPTRELSVPGCTLFRRNSRDTFVLSAAESLGPVWGVRIWHDNSGASPHFYLKLVEVSEPGRADARRLFFVGQCWLSASRGDGRVERMLRVCTRGIGVARMMRLTLCDYLADFHTWMSVYTCPQPHSFTRTQRLAVCLLLFAGYACVNALIVAQTQEVLHFEAGTTALSATSLTAGLSSVAVVLPVATLITFLFRLRGAKLTTGEERSRTGRDPREVGNPDSAQKNDRPVARDVKNGEIQTEVIQKRMRFQEGAPCQAASQGGGSRRAACSERRPRLAAFDELRRRTMRAARLWCYHLPWTLCLLLSFAGLLITVLLGLRFSSSKLRLWLQSTFLSLASCFFLIQPIGILAVGVTLSVCYRNRTDFQSPSRITFKAAEQLACALRSDGISDLQKRRRVRFLRLVRPPTVAELRLTRARRSRDAFIGRTLRDLCVLVAMLLLMLCIANGSSFRVYRTPTARDDVVTVCQLLFLCLSLLHLSIQVGTAWRKGLLGYCAAPRNWLHVILQMVIFLYSYHHIYYSVESVEVVELLRRSDGKERVDVSHLAAREQHIRSLRGLLLLLLTAKCATMLTLTRRSTTPSTRLIPNLMLLLAAHSLPTLLCNNCDLRSGYSFLSFRSLCLSFAAAMMASVSSSGRKRRQSRKDVCTVRELGGYIRRRVRELTGHEEQARPAVESKTYYLEEFETVVDELLFKLNRLHATLLPVAHHAHIDDSPAASHTSQNSERTRSTEPEAPVNATPLQSAEGLQNKEFRPTSTRAALPRPSASGGESKSMVGELQSGRAECLSVLNDALERQTSHVTRRSDSCLTRQNITCRTTTQAPHTEMLVEVVIHNKPL